MKKTLLLQTALVAAAGVMVADASFAQVKAEPLSVTVNGAVSMGLKYRFSDRDSQSLNNQNGTTATSGLNSSQISQDSEIHFNIKSVLDNGLKIGGRVELEATTEADQIDESYITVEYTDWGRMEIGSADRIGTKMLLGAPSQTPWNTGTVFSTELNPLNAPAGARTGSPLMRYTYSSDDTNGINIYTSANRYFGSKAGKGLMLGFSWNPDGCQDSSAQGTVPACTGGFNNSDTANAAVVGQNIQIGANYLESFGQFDLGIGGTYMTAKTEGASTGADLNSGVVVDGSAGGAASVFTNRSVQGWQIGGNVTYNVGDGSTVTLGGGYKAEEMGSNVVGSTIGDDTRKVWNVGIQYLSNGANPGSWGVSTLYSRSKAPQGNVNEAATAGDDTLKYWELGASYVLGTGITAKAGLVNAKFTDAVAPNNTLNNDSKQTAGVVSLTLVF